MPLPRSPIHVLVAALAASLTVSACAAEAPTPAAEDGPRGETQSAFSLTENCPWKVGDWYRCTNKKKDLVNTDSFPLFYDLYAWGDERVEVKNTSQVSVVFYVAQGFNKKDYFTTLRPNESVVFERIDPVTPHYHLLFYPVVEAPRESVWVEARPFGG